MPACTSLNISMQFMTTLVFLNFSTNRTLFRQADALLFYNGPTDTQTNDLQIDYRDYLIIQLKGGRVNVEMSMTGLNKVTMQVMSSALNDGTWHDISLTQIGKVRFLLD